jgi:hypothetical protein
MIIKISQLWNIFKLLRYPFNIKETVSVDNCKMIGVGKGEAVVNYCKPLTTKDMAYYRLSRRVNKMKILFNIS